MSEASTDQIERSLVDQIIQRTFAILADGPNTNPALIQQLRNLANAGDLKKHSLVSSAIKNALPESE